VKRESDRKVKKYKHSQLRSDPCAYIRGAGREFEIVTVWVDDLLPYATTDEM
jgi:hypothetical protein